MTLAPPAPARHRLRRPLRLSRPCSAPLHAFRNLRAGLPDLGEKAARKSCAATNKRNTPCRRSGSGRREKQLCDARSNAIPSGSPLDIRPGAPNPTARPKSTPETAPSTTPTIRPCMALVAVMGKGRTRLQRPPDRRRRILNNKGDCDGRLPNDHRPDYRETGVAAAALRNYTVTTPESRPLA